MKNEGIELMSVNIPLRGHTMDSMGIVKKVETAINDGKIRPDQRTWAINYATTDPKGFEVFVNKVHRGIMSGHSPSKAKTAQVTDEAQLQINKMCGVDDNTWKKYGPQANEGKASNSSSGGSPDETQRLINTLFGITGKEVNKAADTDGEPLDETQLLINKLMGVDTATFRKYSNR
jgi:hypothetical protein